MAELPDFQARQYAFAAHIRDPENVAAPAGIEDRRMAIYRELFFNNLRRLLGSTFPVLKKLHDDEKWRALVRQFMISHRAQTPYFLEIPREFLAFLENEYRGTENDFPFLLELAHYEWIELALSVSADSVDETVFDPAGDLLEGVPVKSPLARLCSYRYPVHRISTSYMPTEAGEQPTFLVVYRKRDDALGFMELNPVTARLLERIEHNETATGRQLLEELAEEIGYADAAALVDHGAGAMQEMLDAEILLGVSRSPRVTK